MQSPSARRLAADRPSIGPGNESRRDRLDRSRRPIYEDLLIDALERVRGAGMSCMTATGAIPADECRSPRSGRRSRPCVDGSARAGRRWIVTRFEAWHEAARPLGRSDPASPGPPARNSPPSLPSEAFRGSRRWSKLMPLPDRMGCMARSPPTCRRRAGRNLSRSRCPHVRGHRGRASPRRIPARPGSQPLSNRNQRGDLTWKVCKKYTKKHGEL